MHRGLVAAAFAMACTAPTIGVAPGSETGPADSRAEAADAPICRPVRAPDGGTCDPSVDEDSDCIPDDCDDCPSVPQAPVTVSSGTATAGPACTYPGPFEAMTRRVAFQGFARGSHLAWADPESAWGDEKLRFEDGYATMGRVGGTERIAILPLSLGTRDVVVTAVLRLPVGGNASVVARTSVERPRSAYACVVDGRTFSLRVVTCDGVGACTGRTVVDTSGATASKFMPAEVVVDERFLLRLAVKTMSPALVRLGCQVFAAPKTPADVAGTLRSLDTEKNSLTVDTDVVVSGGEPAIGTFQSPLEIHSVDVLAAP